MEAWPAWRRRPTAPPRSTVPSSSRATAGPIAAPVSGVAVVAAFTAPVTGTGDGEVVCWAWTPPMRDGDGDAFGALGWELGGGSDRGLLGELDGEPLGELDGEPLGEPDGEPLGEPDGEPLGELDGEPLGEPDGEPLGELDGEPLGELDGEPLGELDGEPLGEPDGESLGEPDGELLGEPDGELLGGFDGLDPKRPTDSERACAAKPVPPKEAQTAFTPLANRTPGGVPLRATEYSQLAVAPGAAETIVGRVESVTTT